MVTYILHSSILLSAITAIYWLGLRHETFFKLNRWTMMLSVVLSLTLPLITIPAEYAVWRSNDAPVSSIVEKIVPQESVDISSPDVYDTPAYPTDKKAKKPVASDNVNYSDEASNTYADTDDTFSMASIGKILTIIYFIGVGIFTMVFLMQLFVLLTSKANLNSFKTGRYHIVEMVKDKEPFSFLNSIYINPSSYDEDTYNHIIEHEKIHIDQSHFIDKIIAEILVIIFWFNPFTWLLRSGISRNLEFLTDHSLLNKGVAKKSYQMSLLKVSVSNQPFNLTMSYNSSFLKNRIDMMNAKKSSIVSSWKYLFVPPLFLLSVFSLNAIDGGYATNDTEAIIATETPTEKAKASSSELPKEKAKAVPKSNALSKSKPMAKTEVAATSEWKKESNSDINVAFVSRTLDLDDFNSLGLAVNGDVELKYGNRQSVKVEGPANLIDDLNTEVKNGDWNIKFVDHKMMGKVGKLKFYITMTELSSIAISGNGNVKTVNKFKDLDHLNMAVSGNGDIEVDADSESVFYAISGNGNADFKGSTGDLVIRSSGNGKVIADDLEASTCDVIVSGSGDVYVDVSKRLSVKISGSANVYYKGDPSISSQTSGSGKIRTRSRERE